MGVQTKRWTLGTQIGASRVRAMTIGATRVRISSVDASRVRIPSIQAPFSPPDGHSPHPRCADSRKPNPGCVGDGNWARGLVGEGKTRSRRRHGQTAATARTGPPDRQRTTSRSIDLVYSCPQTLSDSQGSPSHAALTPSPNRKSNPGRAGGAEPGPGARDSQRPGPQASRTGGRDSLAPRPQVAKPP